jgi:hypothetical protein
MALVDTIELYKVLAALAYSIQDLDWGMGIPHTDFAPGIPIQGSGVTRMITDPHEARGIFEALRNYLEAERFEDYDLSHFAVAAELDRISYPPRLHIHLREELDEKDFADRE